MRIPDSLQATSTQGGTPSAGLVADGSPTSAGMIKPSRWDRHQLSSVESEWVVKNNAARIGSDGAFYAIASLTSTLMGGPIVWVRTILRI